MMGVRGLIRTASPGGWAAWNGATGQSELCSSDPRAVNVGCTLDRQPEPGGRQRALYGQSAHAAAARRGFVCLRGWNGLITAPDELRSVGRHAGIAVRRAR